MKSDFRPDLMEGKVVLVTGGGSGICRGITHEFMAHGAHAVISSRNQDRLDQSAAELQTATGRRCLGLSADVRDPEALGRVVDRTLQEFGRIDVLVNGAAGNFLCPASQLSPNGFRTVLEIDTAGTFNASRAVFDRWFSEHGGNIINISATLHYGSTPLQVHAAAAKSAVDALTRTLAAEWGPTGVRINAIAPGPIDGTEGIARLLPEPTRARLEGTIPIRRMGRIDEIAKVALFLAADASSLVHGEILVADGGAWLTGSRLVAMPG